jgi:hypothetical protein
MQYRTAEQILQTNGTKKLYALNKLNELTEQMCILIEQNSDTHRTYYIYTYRTKQTYAWNKLYKLTEQKYCTYQTN